MLKPSSLSSLALSLSLSLPLFAAAQVPVYGQCGGNGWTGPTTCVSRATCTVINEWYYQCFYVITNAYIASPNLNSRPGGPGGPTTTTTTTTTTPGGPATPAAGNPYTGYEVYLTPYYATEVQAAAAQISDSTVKAKALKVAQIPRFTWFDVIAKTSTLGNYLAEADQLANPRARHTSSKSSFMTFLVATVLLWLRTESPAL